MSHGSSSPVPGDRSSPSPEPDSENYINGSHNPDPVLKEETAAVPPPTTRSNRPSRACTIRAASRLYSSPPAIERKPKKEQRREESPPEQCSKIVTPLVEPPTESQLPRWNLRSMWELASVLNFLRLFRPLLNISHEFSAEEFETALLNPNDTLFYIHMPLLKAIPPITRMALTRDTWITVLCRKLRDWWHWVAEGDLPIVASHGTEIEVYKSLDPSVRVIILKALCDIRVELGTNNGAQPCQYQTVISEYTANGTASQPSSAESAKPTEVRRIFTMGLPFTSQHGGQILFGPNDGYLYFMMGDGGGSGDPYNFAQNKKSLLGKVMRLDVNNIPSASEVSKLGLWGSYSIPKDNPFSEDKDLQPEIWALGLRNPWRCSFDSQKPSYFFCGDVGQDLYEEVDLITKGGNYGWRVYEGLYPFTPTESPGGNTSLNSINPIPPILGYNHSQINKNEGSASITGGYVYRSSTDPCMFGRYLYTDLYAGAMWAATEDPENSGNFTTSTIPFSCAGDSPIKCDSVSGSSLPALGYIYSFGEDNKKDVYILASSGVYRVVPPSRCSYNCSLEKATTTTTTTTTSSPSPSHASQWSNFYQYLFLQLFSLLFLFTVNYV